MTKNKDELKKRLKDAATVPDHVPDDAKVDELLTALNGQDPQPVYIEDKDKRKR